MSNAAVTAQTASSWSTQPIVWNGSRATAARGVRSTARPWRAIASSRRTVPALSRWTRWCARRAERTADGEQRDARRARRSRGRHRPVRDLRRQEDVRRRAARRGRGRTAGARTPSRGASRSCPGRAGRGAAAPRRARARRPARAARRCRAARPRTRRRPGRTTGAAAGSAWSIVRFQESARASTESRLSTTRDGDPAPADEVERVVDDVPVRPAPPDQRRSRAPSEREDEDPASPRVRERRPAAGSRGHPSLDAARRRARTPPRAARAMSGQAYCSSARARAGGAHRRAPAGSSASSRSTAVGERARVVRGDGDGRLGRDHLPVAGDVGRDDRGRARERARQHHPEALAAERRRDQRLRRAQQRR